MANKNIAIGCEPKLKEYTAEAAITPGHLVELMSSGNVRVHATAGGTAATRFAMADMNQGKEIDDAYAADTVCLCGSFSPGDEVNAILANGESAAINDFLESEGDGTLRVVDIDPSAGAISVQSIVGVALEAIDMSRSSGFDPSGRIRIEIV